MFLLYSLLFSFGVLLAAPYYLVRQRRTVASRAYWRERCGLLPPSYQQAERGAIWVHGVSVGETLAVAALVRQIQEHYPERKIFLSHVTAAGREAGEKRLTGVAGRFYLPLDWSWSVRRAFNHIRPALLLIVETELWPNLLRQARQFGTRIVLANARISDRSFRRYRMLAPFMRRVLENIDWVSAQTARDAERFKSLGMRPDRVAVAGNLKFDMDRPPSAGERLMSALAGARRSPVVVAASTMPGEEPLVLEAWSQIQRAHSRGLLILAPRHPARFESIAELLSSRKRSFVRRTALSSSEVELASQLATTEILLLDTIGELAGIFELADVVFVGGSLVPSGGHNLLEPAFWAKPILFGPYMENFRDIAQLFLEAGAALEVSSPRELAERTLELLGNEARRRELGEKAKQVLEQASGATERVLEQIRELLDSEVSLRAGIVASGR